MRVSLWLALLLTAGLGLYGMRPPAARGPEAAADQFSAMRAIAHLPHFAAQPHPTGSAANGRAREYLVAILRALGAEVRIEKTTGRHTRGKRVWEGEAQNIVATLPGTDNHRAVMLAAHYDSVPAGPGAADDGAGVISILEALRAVRAGPPLANDLLILLTDGEEAGLLGAAGFVADHPDLSSRVGIVVNLEARGSSGPALMFETSDQNGWLIPEFARAAPYPMASSLMYSFYKLMPNDTDLTELKKSGVGALNFAFTETVKNYHSAHD
ncbi:MAG: M20/M25/M40 family metallo-hydrolase, partial [Chthoniobacterales bacterium]